MRKLLRANFTRLIKNKLFWILMALEFVMGAGLPVLHYLDNQNANGEWTLDACIFSYAMFVPILLSALAALFIGSEYSDGTMRNKLIVGHRRSNIYMADLIVSKDFIESHSDLLSYTYPEDNDYSGAVVAYIMFKGKGPIEPKLHQLLEETGYTCDSMGGDWEEDNYVKADVSPAYQGSGVSGNLFMVIAVAIGVLLIMMTGYLIIYNIFQISVIQDIQSYGQLKTLGATGKQIRQLINRQAFRLSCIGIPIGLFVGFFMGRSLVPFLMNGTEYAADAGVRVSVNPLIFIASAIFALVTVYVSIRKPANIAGSISPVEALRYTECSMPVYGSKKKTKKSLHGAQIYRMSWANLWRHRKSTVLVIVSMTLSLLLFHTVFTLSSGFDIDKYVGRFLNKDFIISSADYFQYRFEQSDNELSESFIEAMKL